MPIRRSQVDRSLLNLTRDYPYSLRADDFAAAMSDIYDFFFDVNSFLTGRSLPRLDDMLRASAMSGILSDMLTASLARHSRNLSENKFHNGHPDLIVRGRYANDAVKSGTDGIEVKSTRKKGGAVDTHGARDQWMCVFVYRVDNVSEPAIERAPTRFTEVYLAQVSRQDFRRNDRSELGTRTASLHAKGVKVLRDGWIYREPTEVVRADGSRRSRSR